jgi:cellulose synthase/poly-beta-1,6-N-acetylglucosamine synthase-like glycosyltransferase
MTFCVQISSVKSLGSSLQVFVSNSTLEQPVVAIDLSSGSSRIKAAFYSLTLAIYLTIEFILGYFVIRWASPGSVLLFGVISVLFTAAAYGTAREVLGLALGGRSSIASLGQLTTSPRVALLYTTMNDVVPECLATTNQDYPSNVYVIDDSSDPEARSTVDRIAQEKGLTVVRRSERRGFKAGAINDWLAKHGSEYDYIVLLDSDSYLPPDWVGQALRYAEHPGNERVAIFQGLINIWNLDTRFAKTLAPMSKLGQFVWERRLANSLDAVFCYGHNVMVRVSALARIGGFVEGFVSEDFATAVALAQKGWHSRFIPLHTYEAVPENIRGFIKRQNKWTRGSMEFFGFARKPSISYEKGYLLLQTPFGHVINLLLPVGALLTVYGFASTPAGAGSFLLSLLRNPLSTVWSVPIFRLLIGWGLLGAFLGMLVRYRSGVTLTEYLRHRVLSGAISAIMIPYELKSMLSYFVGGLRQIPVTPKSEKPLSASEVFHISRYSLVFQGLLWAGILEFNPLAAVFNASWLVPMLLSPFVVMWFSKALASSDRNSLLGSGGLLLSAARANPSLVNQHLNALVTSQTTSPATALLSGSLKKQPVPQLASPPDLAH